MTDKTTEGYTALPNDIEGMLRNLCAYALSEPEPLQRYIELTHQQVLFDGVVNAIRRERGRALADMSAAGKPIEDLASQVKLTPPHVRALVKEAGLTLARPKSVARREATKSGRTMTRKTLRPGESAARSITEPTRLGGAPPAVKSGGWLGGLLGPRRSAESAPAAPTKTAAPAPAPQRTAAPAPQRTAAPAPIRTEGTTPTRIPAADPTKNHRPVAAPPARSAPASTATATRTPPQAPPRSAPAQAAPPAPSRSAPPQAPPRSTPPQAPSRAVSPQAPSRSVPPLPAPKQSAPKSSRRRGPTLPETISVNRGEERTLTAAERKALGLPVPKPVAGKGRRKR